MNKITRVSWDEVKHQVKQVNESIYRVIEDITPGKEIPFYLARYKFGEHFGIKNHAYLPTSNGQMEKLTASTQIMSYLIILVMAKIVYPWA